MFTGKQVYLRPLEEEDLPLRVKWVNDPEVRNTLMFDYPLSLAKTRHWFSSTVADSAKMHFSIVDKDNGAVIGMTGLLQIDIKHQKAQFYITIGEKEYWGRRIADEVIPMVLEYGFTELNLNKIYLYTIPNNERARKVYERNGFVLEGILREHHYCVGDFQDLYQHSILRRDWFERKGRQTAVALNGQETNVLLTCAGRRNYLVRSFRSALGGRGRVYAADTSPSAPALYEADEAFIVPPVTQEDYFDALLEICRKHEVKLLISLNDLELPLLAERRDLFEAAGTLAVVSSPEAVNICFDKWKTCEFLAGCGIKTPKTYCALEDARKAVSRGEVAFPLVIKPRWGTASIGIEFAADDDELETAYRLVRGRLSRTMLAGASAADPERSVLIQEKLDGAEHGLDVVNDLGGGYVCTFARQKLAMRAGETDRAVTVDNPELASLGRKLGKKLGHIGNLDCDVFVNENGCYVLEVNPRFGGGYPFSHAAGANLPAALIAWANGQEADPEWLTIKPGVSASKCDRLVVHGGAVEPGKLKAAA